MPVPDDGVLTSGMVVVDGRNQPASCYFDAAQKNPVSRTLWFMELTRQPFVRRDLLAGQPKSPRSAGPNQQEQC